MNKVTLQGRLVADPTYVTHETFSVADFTLAVNRRFKPKDESKPSADFIRCRAYNKTAELITQYHKKGNWMLVEGEWRTDNYTKEDGTPVYTNVCVINEFYFQPGNSGNPDQPISSNSNESSGFKLNSRTAHLNQPEPVQPRPISPVPQEPIQQPEIDVIPQAFDSDIDLSDEFPW